MLVVHVAASRIWACVRLMRPLIVFVDCVRHDSEWLLRSIVPVCVRSLAVRIEDQVIDDGREKSGWTTAMDVACEGWRWFAR